MTDRILSNLIALFTAVALIGLGAPYLSGVEDVAGIVRFWSRAQ